MYSWQYLGARCKGVLPPVSAGVGTYRATLIGAGRPLLSLPAGPSVSPLIRLESFSYMHEFVDKWP